MRKRKQECPGNKEDEILGFAAITPVERIVLLSSVLQGILPEMKKFS
jgi:hypothetical protein